MSRTKIMRSASVRALSIAVGFGLFGHAYAQDVKPLAVPATAAEDQDTGVGEVVVTGSFLHSSAEDSAIPVQVITAKELENRGSPSATEVLKTLNVAGGNVAAESNRYNGYPVNYATVNLRGIGANRTVVLMNGRRFAEQFGFATGRANNINQIPSAALGSVQIVTEGGATTYGADAVGGVVNYITRHGFDGTEAKANYRYIDGTDGNWGASILTGKAYNKADLLLSMEYTKTTPLDADARDFANRSYLENNATGVWSANGNPGSFIFDTSTVAGNSITPTGTGLNQYNVATSNAQIGATGIVRDQNCNALGGFSGFSTTASPVCYFHVDGFDRLAEETSTFNLYGEFNAEFSDALNFHGEVAYYQTHVDAAAQPSDENFVGYGLPLVPGTTASQGFFATAGANPAVADFLAKFRNSDGTTAYTPAQIAAITTGGRVRLSAWRPFAEGGNPILGRHDFQTIDQKQLRFVGGFKGELGTVLGTKLSYDAGLTYTRTLYNQATEDMRTDRLQAALNGLGGPSCTGSTPGANGCLYFNPFSSAVQSNLYTGQTNPNFIGSGTYTGYTAGQGLTNSTALVNWLYVPLWNKRTYDQVSADLLFTGETPVKLPGGPIVIAVGTQFRYNRQDDRLDDFSNLSVTPCAGVGLGASACASNTGDLVFSRNLSVMGPSRERTRTYPVYAAFTEIALPVFEHFNISASGRWEKFMSDLTDVNNDVFVPAVSAKWQANNWLAVRGTWGKTFSYVSPEAYVTPAVVSLQTTTVSGLNGSFGIGGATNPLQFRTANNVNTGVKPETGTNYNLGLLFNLSSKLHASVDYYNIEIDDFARTMTVANVVQALVVPGQIAGPNNLVNCASPLLQTQAGLGNLPFVQLSGPCVQGATTLSSGGGLAGSTLGTQGQINYFGGTRQVNGGTFSTSGVDLSADYTFDEVLGGRLTVQGSATRVLTFELSDFVVYGATVAAGYDGLGYLNASTNRGNGPINRWRGQVSLNWKHDIHNLNLTTSFATGLTNDNVAIFVENAALNANIGNGSGVLTCPTTDLNPIINQNNAVPTGAGTAMYGQYCANQNYSNGLGQSLAGQITADATYRLDLTEKFSVSVTVNNLFNTDPKFSRSKFSYDTSTGSPLGRNVKLAITKRF